MTHPCARPRLCDFLAWKQTNKRSPRSAFRPSSQLLGLLGLWLVLTSTPLIAGAWGYGGFQNDDALDWVDNELVSAGPIVIATALAHVNTNHDYLEAPECCAAIAAAEVLAAALGHPAPELPPAVADWVKAHPMQPDAKLLASTRAALTRILTRSELRDLWADSELNEKWRQSLAALAARLAP